MRHTTAKTFTIAAVSALALGIAPTMSAADKGCSNASLQGTSYFALLAPTPVAFSAAFLYSGQVSRIRTGRLIDQPERKFHLRSAYEKHNET